MEVRVADCPLGAKCEEVKTENGKQYIARCPWYVQVKGYDPNSGQEVDKWACSIALLPMLTINVANEARQGAAATESFRNEVVTQNAVTQQIARLQLQAMAAPIQFIEEK